MEKNYKTKLPKDVKTYIDKINSCPNVVNRERKLLVDLIDDIFANETLIYDEKQIEKYFSYEKYFDFNLFDWEKFVFVLHNCVFREDGFPRWTLLVLYLGRGAGKNGYLAFEDFCLITPTNGIKNYHIDICATSEDQARTSFDDIYEILEHPVNPKFKKVLEKSFTWNKTIITNKETNSNIRFRTNNSKTKDGGRPGKVDFDEYHAYVDYDNIKVFTTGLGKKDAPRRTIATTDGYERGGPLDDLKQNCLDILNRRVPDNGILPFMCKLDDENEVHDKTKWQKANPSLEYKLNLLLEMEQEYLEYSINPINNSSFMVKRMNMPIMPEEQQVTSWENILATAFITEDNGVKIARKLPDLTGKRCVAGIDFASLADMASACITFKINGYIYSIKHSWICEKSKDLPRINAPLRDWEKQGLITFVKSAEINPDLISYWLLEQARKYKLTIVKIALDKYRTNQVRNSLANIGFDVDDSTVVKCVRPSDIMLAVGPITTAFNFHKIVWGDDPLIRWACWNACLEPRPNNNYIYGKKEAKSRKTDPFMAFVHSFILIDEASLERKIEDVIPVFLDI